MEVSFIAEDKKADKARSLVRTRKDEAEDSRRPKEDLWEECYQIYRAYRKERDDDKSNLFIPYLFGLIETVVPRITDTIFAKKPYLKPLPREPQDIEASESMQVLLDYQMDKCRFEEKITDAVKTATIYGTGYVKVYWDKQTETVVRKKRRQLTQPLDIVKLMQELGMENASRYVEVEEEVTRYEGVNIEPLDIFDVYVDPYAEDIESARYVIHETLKPLSHLENMIKQGVYELPEGVKMKDIKESSPDREENSALDRQQDIGMANKPTNPEGMVNILEYWENDRVVVLVNDEYVVRDEKNPYHHKKIPIVKMVDTRVPKESDGIGEIEPNRYLQAELNTNRNQRIENVKMAINNMWAYQEGAIDPDDLKSKPNQAIPIRQGQNVNEVLQQFQPQRIHPSSYTEEDIIKRDMQETSGVTKYVRGIQPSGSATATEITSLQREANYRFKEKIRNIVRSIEKIGDLFVQLNQQFLTENQYIRVSNDRAEQTNIPLAQGMPQNSEFQFLNLSPESIMGEFDINVASSALEPLADRQVKRQQLLELWQIAMNNQIKLPSLFEEIVKTYDMPQVDKMLEEYKAEMAQMQQLQQLKFQAQNKGNPQSAPQPSSQPPNPMGQMGGMNG